MLFQIELNDGSISEILLDQQLDRVSSERRQHQPFGLDLRLVGSQLNVGAEPETR